MNRSYLSILAVSVLAAALAACSEAPELHQYGASPEIPAPNRGVMPDMIIAKPAAWGDRVPTVPQGYAIAAIATDLGIPRQTLVLPNGDQAQAQGRDRRQDQGQGQHLGEERQPPHPAARCRRRRHL